VQSRLADLAALMGALNADQMMPRLGEAMHGFA
jgi:hypothetical protein